MIRRSFSVFPGVGPGREQALHAAGLTDWDRFLTTSPVPGMSERLRSKVADCIEQWSLALDRSDAAFFAANLKRAHHWTLFDEFGDGVRYLDIETTGLSAHRHDVTVVGIFDGREYRSLVRGRDLEAMAIQEALDGAKLLVSYYGTVFDVPFLRVAFPSVNWDLPHFDLCFAGRKVGLKGGLKTVERLLGMRRASDIEEVDGFEAVRLWRRHQLGHPHALETLVEYNRADTVNLANIASAVYERLCSGQVEWEGRTPPEPATVPARPADGG